MEDRQDGGQARIECGNKMTQPTSEANTKLTGKRKRNGHFMKCLMDVNYVWQLPIDVYVLCLSVCMCECVWPYLLNTWLTKRAKSVVCASGGMLPAGIGN